jgi:type IV secretory pathway TrbL component
MEQILNTLETLIRPGIVLLVLVVLLIVNSFLFRKIKSFKPNETLTKGAISFFLVLIAILVFILTLPIDKSLKGQILGFLGIIISAGIALSSTTVLGNMIAGIMNGLT